MGKITRPNCSVHCLRWSKTQFDKRSSSINKPPFFPTSKTVPITLGRDSSSRKVGCSRKSATTIKTLFFQDFLSSKTEQKSKINFRLKCSKSKECLRIFQDGIYFFNSRNKSRANVGSFIRPERSLLSCSDTQRSSKIFRFSSKQRKIPIPLSSFWTKFSSKDVYQNYKTNPGLSSSSKNKSTCLSRRLVNFSEECRGMQNSSSIHHKPATKPGVYYKHEPKIKPCSKSKNSIFGSKLEFKTPQDFLTRGKKTKNYRFLQNVNKILLDNKKDVREVSRASKFLWPVFKAGKVASHSHYIQNEQNNFSGIQRSQNCNPRRPKEGSSMVVSLGKSKFIPFLVKINSRDKIIHRCLTKGLGMSSGDEQQDFYISRNLARSGSEQINKLQRNESSLERSQSFFTPSKFKENNFVFRQFNHSLISKEPGRSAIKGSSQLDGKNSMAVLPKSNRSCHSPYSRETECKCRFSFERLPFNNGMEIKSKSFSTDKQSMGTDSDRYVCHSKQ